MRTHGLAALALMAGCAQAQTPAVFEVASVKPAGNAPSIGMYTATGGRISITNYTLRMLIHEAYEVEDYSIAGGPKWAGEERFDIEAKPPASSPSSRYVTRNPKLPPPKEELAMLRALLEERFALKTHMETKEGAVYALVVGPQGAKMKEAKDKEDFPVVSYGRTGKPENPDFKHAYNATMPLFARNLAGELKRPVLDQTGLRGSYDFFFEYVRNPAESAEGPTLLTAIQQLGLKLVTTKGPLVTLVIDSAEKPSTN